MSEFDAHNEFQNELNEAYTLGVYGGDEAGAKLEKTLIENKNLKEENEKLKKEVELLQAQKKYYQVNLRAINYISGDAGDPVAPIVYDSAGCPETYEELEYFTYKHVK